MLRIHLDERRSRSPNNSAYCCTPSNKAARPEDYRPDAGTCPDDGRGAGSPAPSRTPASRLLDLLGSSSKPPYGGNYTSMRAFKPRHVKKHLDRDDKDQDDQREEQGARPRNYMAHANQYASVAGSPGDLADASESAIKSLTWWRISSISSPSQSSHAWSESMSLLGRSLLSRLEATSLAQSSISTCPRVPRPGQSPPRLIAIQTAVPATASDPRSTIATDSPTRQLQAREVATAAAA